MTFQAADPRSLAGRRHPLASVKHSHFAVIGPGSGPRSTRFLLLAEGWHARWALTPEKAAFLHAMIARGRPSEV